MRKTFVLLPLLASITSLSYATSQCVLGTSRTATVAITTPPPDAETP